MTHGNRDLDSIGFQIHKPHEELSPYVQCYWSVYKATPLLKPSRHKIVSDGGSGVVFNYGGPLNITIGNHAVNDIRGCFVTGPTVKATYLTLMASINAMGIRFRPGGAYPFIQKYLVEYQDAVLLNNAEAGEIWNELWLQLLDTSSDKVVGLIDKVLLRELAETKRNLSSWTISAIHTVLKHRGSMRIDDLCADMAISRRQFERTFKKVVGLLPKQLSRVVRIESSRALIRTFDFRTLSDIAYECGYFDQAHFCKEFKALVETTPQEYLKKKRENMPLSYNP